MTSARPSPSAIVFGYHDVGVRCLRVLLDAGVHVPLVVTHRDDPSEHTWFASVAETAADVGLRCTAPEDPNAPDFIAFARETAGPVDFVFSLYYRRLLGPGWLAMPRKGAFNMHGSLLPKYRGRAPVNWAVIHGERETGATLHAMNEKPDLGAIVDQCAVPILSDDTAAEVMRKVVVAAEIVLARSLPKLVDGTARLTPQDPHEGHYFGGRRPEDGRIPAGASARQIHDLVRALAPPYPGAFVLVRGRCIVIERARRADAPAGATGDGLRLFSDGDALWALATDGGALRIIAARCDGVAGSLDAKAFEREFAGRCVPADL